MSKRKSRAKWRPGFRIWGLGQIGAMVSKYRGRPGELLFYYRNSRRPISWGWIQNWQIGRVINAIQSGHLRRAVPRKDVTT